MTTVVLTFCEALADQRTTAHVVSRVVRERADDWLRVMMEDTPEVVLGWRGRPEPQHVGQQSNASEDHFIAWQDVDRTMRELGLRRRYGHFAGEPGAEDSAAGRNALQIADRLRRSGQLDAVALVRDADDKPQRRHGLEQARAEIQDKIPVLVGVAVPKREAWVLAAFTPRDERERVEAEECAKVLGFDPCEHAERLGAKTEDAKRSAKRVLERLSHGAAEREAQGWRETPMEVIERRGARSGLSDFVREVEHRLLPVLQGRRGV